MTDRESREAVARQLEQARDLLLDLTLRNRLLNYRHTRRTTVPIIDEAVDPIWDMLYQKERSLSFRAREENPSASAAEQEAPSAAAPAAAATEEPDTPTTFALPAADTALSEEERKEPARHHDRFLQTPLPGPDLQKNLLRTSQAAESALLEKGANFLFLAFGFLRWRRDDQPDRDLLAPIVLLPVRLGRSSVKGRFSLTALGDDPLINPCLRALLAKNHGITLPADPEDFETFSPGAYLSAVTEAIRDQASWRAEPSMSLALFSFTKYLMYLDLEPSRWDAEGALLDHALVSALCGLGGGPQNPSAASVDPDDIHPADSFCVLDADSSQLDAIRSARRGESFVLEGPPGTGKSQTITNVIAECLAAGKTVLFVSEKMAALEVVKRRLDKVGLGEFCLELHSTKANRRSVVDQIGAALEQGRLADPVDAAEAERLQVVRQRLNAYVADLHEPLAPSGLSPYLLLGQLLARHDQASPPVDLPGCESWDPSTIDRHRQAVDRWTRALQAVYPPARHPFRGVGLEAIDSRRQAVAQNAIADLRAVLQDAGQAADRVSAELEVIQPENLQDAEDLLAVAEHFCASPGINPHLLRGEVWDALDRKTETLLERLEQLQQERTWAADRYAPEALASMDWEGIRKRYRNNWVSWVRVFRPGYWQDRRQVRDACKPGHRPNHEQALLDLEHLSRLRGLIDYLKGKQDRGRRAFDAFWRGEDSNPDILRKLADWLLVARRAVREGRAGPKAVDLAAAGAYRDGLKSAARALRDANAAWSRDLSSLISSLSLDVTAAFGSPIAAVARTRLDDRLDRMLHRFEALHDWIRYSAARRPLEAGPLRSFAQQTLADGLEPDSLPAAFDKRLAQILYELAERERPGLAGFHGEDRQADRLLFGQLDRQWQSLTSLRLQARLSQRRPSTSFGAADSSELGILLGELRRKRGGRPIRRLLADAEELIGRVKPCFMMSPLSVAQFLAADRTAFDLVVFDEASQVEPADALGAIARGRQLLLVGDSNQLPPTGFFKALAGEGPAAPALDGAATIADMESILDRGASVLPSRRLRWHFRSRHDSLIAFSNREFYEGQLVVFPASHRKGTDLGLQVRYHPEDGYDRGGTQTNPDQARRIAAWVFDQARRHPDLSIGVGAFSRNQQQAILDEIERLRIEDDSLEAFFAPGGEEPFFVKNLETIQGDERDVIALSVGYGRREPQERLSMNFGPLNQDGGWRRLNVLVTRARRSCVIFTSIRPEDFDLRGTNSRGALALCNYLDFAFSGSHRVGDGEAGLDDPLKRWVHRALADSGLQTGTGIGLSGQPIALAVADAADPGRYVLGLEFDDQAYRRAGSARDRDRLRQQVLEGLGWRIFRVWAPDWARTPEQSIQRLLDAAARAARGDWLAEFSDPAPTATKPALERIEEESETFGFAPYRVYEAKPADQPEAFYRQSSHDLARRLANIVETEGPIHLGELLKRLADTFQIARVGSKVRDRGTSALLLAATEGLLVKRDRFVWPKGMQAPPVRCREEERLREVALICPEEIEQAALVLLGIQGGMSRDDLVVQVARALGFAATGARIAAAVEEAIDRLLAANRLLRDEALLRLPDEDAARAQAAAPATSADTSGETPRCEACGTAIKPKALFCPECGRRVSASCKGCGRALKPSEKFCPECGAKRIP